MWEERGSVAKNATFSSNYNIVKMLKSANITALKAELINIMKENVETILNVSYSITGNILSLNPEVTLIEKNSVALFFLFTLGK